MIKINLLSEKSRPARIQIPFAFLFFVAGLVAIGFGYFALLQYSNNYCVKIIAERDAKQNELDAIQLPDVDGKQRQVQELEDSIERLKRLSGQSMLPWSTVFANLTTVVPKKTVWLTNMRIDSDRRVQMTAFACSEEGKDVSPSQLRLTKGAQDFIKSLEKHMDFGEVSMNSGSKSSYEQMPVWRFEISCRLKRDLNEEGE